ncbi:MAG TPA: hypothetical protein VLY24_09365 [Bryobacteraceae bacterium]|nr:hypothetical protein [Bryobacteraceae bacterium]
MGRKIAFVKQGTMTLYFFGLTEDYEPEEAEKLPLLKTSAYSALGDNTAIPGNNPREAQEYVARIAEALLGVKCAYCNLGRERSAIAIFAFLYVKLHMTKQDAWEKVRAAVEESAVNMPNKKKILDQVEWAIFYSVGYGNLPELYGQH